MKQQNWLMVAIVFCTSFLVYVPTLDGWFVGDDYGFSPLFGMSMKDMLKCLELVHTGELRLHPFRPFAFLTLLTDYQLWGWNPFGFHLTNTVLHSLNAVLVLLLARNLKLYLWSAFVAGLFFGLYPGHSEAVVWISCRFNLLALFLFLLSLLFWVRGRNQRNSLLLTLSILMYLLSLFSKETVAGGIILFPLIDWLFLKDNQSPGQTNAKFWLGWIGAQIGMVLILVLTRVWLFGNLSGDVGITRGQQFCGTTFTDCISRFWRNLWMMVTPVSRDIFTNFAVIVAGVFIMSVCLYVIYTSFAVLRKKDFTPIKLLFLGIIWIAVLVAPTLFVSPVESSLDGSRFLYMPCVGLALIIGLCVKFLESNRRLLIFAITTFFIWLTFSGVVLYQYNNSTWIEAGRVVKEVDQVIFENTLDIQDDDTIIVINLPWLWKGAHFAPNGYPAYLQWTYGIRYVDFLYIERNSVEIDSVWLNSLKQVESRKYYCFIWDDSKQSLEPL